MIDLSKLYLYRMTHIENIRHVNQYGITHRSSPNRNPDFVPIGDSSLIDKRTNFLLPNQRRLGDYIPFYFGPRMPMLYVIQKGYSNVTSVSAEKIVYCITSVADVVCCRSIDFLFTDGHAVDGLSTFFASVDLPTINQIIDQKAVRRQYWLDESDLDLKRRMEAEFLLSGDLPVSAIRGYAVYNEWAKSILLDLGIPSTKLVVKPAFYF
jgi:ssDNA thymidine ADP-ribosyltransferase, DarT